MAKILVVDDEPGIRHLVRQCLEREGHEVHEAVNGSDAIQRLDDGLRPDVILLDLVMPVMTGPELLEAMKARNHTVPVIVLSAYVGVMEFKEDAVVGKLRKPVSIQQLVDEVHKGLSQLQRRATDGE